MADYLARWEINVFDVGSPDDAARKARDAQTRPDTTALVFDVRPLDDPLQARWVRVDLSDATSMAEVWDYGQKAVSAMAQKMVADGADVDAVLEMLAKPWNWPELLTAATLDSAFDAVSPGEDTPDLLEDPPEEAEDDGR